MSFWILDYYVRIFCFLETNKVIKIYLRVQKSPHKFMLTSYIKYFAKFLALLLHNTSFFIFSFFFTSYFILHNLISLLHIYPKFHCHSLNSPIFHYFWFHFGQILCKFNASIIYGLENF